MGASASKAATAAGRGSATRKFPHRAAGLAPPRPSARPGADANEHADAKNKAAIEADGMDPDFTAASGFSQRLHEMGIVEPNPTFSPSSTVAGTERPRSAPLFPSSRTNSTLSVLDARQALQAQADQDLENVGRTGYRGRRLLDMRTVLDIIHMRDHGTPSSAIESRLGLESGIADKLGRHGVLSHVSTSR